LISASDVDSRIHFVFPQIAPGDDEIGFEHDAKYKKKLRAKVLIKLP